MLKNALAETSPFLADSLQGAKVIFNTPEKWVLEFNDTFAQSACQRRKNDFEVIAKSLFKRNISFEFNYVKKTEPVEINKPIYAEVLTQTTPVQTVTQPAKKEELISKEEPFSMQDFSVTENSQQENFKTSEIKAGAATQNILDLFGGQIIKTKDENA